MNYFFVCTYYTVLYLNLLEINKLFGMPLSMRYQAIFQSVVNIIPGAVSYTTSLTTWQWIQFCYLY